MRFPVQPAAVPFQKRAAGRLFAGCGRAGENVAESDRDEPIVVSPSLSRYATGQGAGLGQGITSVGLPTVFPQGRLFNNYQFQDIRELPKRLDLARDAERALAAIPGSIVRNWVEDHL